MYYVRKRGGEGEELNGNGRHSVSMRLVKRRHDALPGVQRQAMADAVEQLERELSRSFGYPSFKSELQKKAVLAVYQGIGVLMNCSFNCLWQ